MNTSLRVFVCPETPFTYTHHSYFYEMNPYT